MESLSEKYSNPLLSYLLTKEKCLKTDLQVIVSNIQTLDKLLIKLQNDNLIKIEKKVMGRRTFEISLTDKGHQVAEQLLNAELAAKGSLKKSFFSRQQLIIMLLGDRGKLTVGQIKEEIPGSYEDLKELEGMKLVTSKLENVRMEKVNHFMLTETGEELFIKMKETENIMKRSINV